MNALRTFTLCCALAVEWSGAAALAQQFPSQQRGLSADTAFQIGAIDHVNLFNGGLTLTLPLTQSYPVGPNLSYGLRLTFGNGWDYEDAVCLDGTINRYNVPIESPHTNVRLGGAFCPARS